MNTPPYEALDVAKYVVFTSTESQSGVLMSNLRIQKVLYFIQLAYLKHNNMPLFLDSIEAWKYGPVVPSVYKVFAVFGGRPIRLAPNEGEQAMQRINKSDQIFVDQVLQESNKFSINQLVDLSHQHSAWISSYPCADQTISLEKLMKQAKIND